MSTSRVEPHELTTRLVELGNELAAAVTPSQKHAAAVELLKVRMIYFTGREDLVRNAHVADVCADLDPEQIKAITDWCWSSYSGGMEHMKRSINERRGIER